MSYTRLNPAANVDFMTGTWDGVATASGTAKSCAKVTLPTSGTWLIVAGVSFPSNSTGARCLGISTNGTSMNKDRRSIVIAQAVNGISTELVLASLQQLDAGDYYVMARQHSGGAMNVSGHYQAIRLV